jgi:hypothetical protein
VTELSQNLQHSGRTGELVSGQWSHTVSDKLLLLMPCSGADASRTSSKILRMAVGGIIGLDEDTMCVQSGLADAKSEGGPKAREGQKRGRAAAVIQPQQCSAKKKKNNNQTKPEGIRPNRGLLDDGLALARRRRRRMKAHSQQNSRRISNASVPNKKKRQTK